MPGPARSLLPPDAIRLGKFVGISHERIRRWLGGAHWDDHAASGSNAASGNVALVNITPCLETCLKQ